MRDSAGTCGSTRWKAAKASSKTMANLDETGLEVAGCRHVIGQKAINMFRGEMLVSLVHYQMWSSSDSFVCSRFGYPHFLHLKFKSVPYVWADIMCQYWKWAQTKQEVSEDFAEALSCTPCLSVMHANAHSWQCQVSICLNLQGLSCLAQWHAHLS